MKPNEFLPTYITSRQLKKHGFKPPEPDAGQFWYGQFGNLVIISQIGDHLVIQTGPENDTRFFYKKSETPSGEDAFYAPQASEIIKRMPEPDKVWLKTDGRNWVCLVKSDEGDKIFVDNNPSEACAKAWLDENPDLEVSK